MTGTCLAIVVKGFPRLSETFIARELEALRCRGIAFSLHALREPGPDAALVGPTPGLHAQYLPEYLSSAPITVLTAVIRCVRMPGFLSAFRSFLHDLMSDFTSARVRRFGQACVLALRVPPETSHFHAHFLHSPASVARYAAKMRRAGYSLSGHAKDIWTTPDGELGEKLAEAAFVTVCNLASYDRVRRMAPSANIHLVHHGVDRRLLAQAPPRQHRDGSDPANPIRLVCVARAVAKKGLATLLTALATLPRDIHWHLDHFGGGLLLQSLQRQADLLGLSGRITWHGPSAHADVITALDGADLFLLPVEVSRDGDRDGIPNALLEAQARGLCVVASDAGGVSEAVTDGETGRLLPAGSSGALMNAIRELAEQPERRQQLGSAALRVRASSWDPEAGYDEIAALLRGAIT